jgi:hypothetical protein
VEKTWSEASLAVPMGNVLAKLGHLHGAMHAWDASVVQEPKKKLRKAQRELDKALSGPMTDENDAKAKEMALIIELLLEQEEIYWLQRSRANWLQQGDRNTSFFHNFASARRKKNFIKKLKNDSNDWVEGTVCFNL